MSQEKMFSLTGNGPAPPPGFFVGLFFFFSRLFNLLRAGSSGRRFRTARADKDSLSVFFSLGTLL